MIYEVTLNGKIYKVDVTETESVITSVTDATPQFQNFTPSTPKKDEGGKKISSGQKVLAPMPGTVLSVDITEGQKVKAGDVLFVLEAMKMENDIVAPADGTVRQILVSKGASVDTDDILAVL